MLTVLLNEVRKKSGKQNFGGCDALKFPITSEARMAFVTGVSFLLKLANA